MCALSTCSAPACAPLFETTKRDVVGRSCPRPAAARDPFAAEVEANAGRKQLLRALASAPNPARWLVGVSCRRWSFRVLARSRPTRLCRDVALRVKGGLAPPPVSARLRNMAAAAAATTTAAPAAEKAPAAVVSSGKPKADSSAAEMTRCDQLGRPQSWHSARFARAGRTLARSHAQCLHPPLNSRCPHASLAQRGLLLRLL